MRDNPDSSPDVIVARQNLKAVARLNLEIATAQNQNINSASPTTNASPSASGYGLSTYTGPTGGGRGPGCFVGETLITTTAFEGQDLTDCAISKIRIGDSVLAFDKTTLEIKEVKVLQTFIHETTELIRVEAENATLLVTPNHKFWTGSEMKAIEDFKIGDSLFDVNYSKNSYFIGYNKIMNIYRLTSSAPILVYNFSTSLTTYFANGIAVSNLKPPEE